MTRKGTLNASYEEGVPLLEAICFFAPEKLWRDYVTACERKKEREEAFRRSQVQFLRDCPSDAPGTVAFAERLGVDLKKLQTDPSYMKILPGDDQLLLQTSDLSPEKFVYAMVQSLLDQARQGEHMAIGYEYPRKLHSKLKRFPDEILRRPSTEFDVRTSGIIGGGLHFVEVRLLPVASASEKLKTEGNERSASDSSKSRSRKPEVLDALDELKRANVINLEEKIKSIWRKVRALIIARTKDPQKLEYTTLFPFIREFLDNWIKSERTSS